ncbi:MAG: NapC/NirT family cytochrome c [Syntrophotaleaceae bacterium]
MAEKSPRASKGLLSYVSRSWIGLAGAALAAFALLILLVLIAYDLLRGFDQPYLGVVVYLILPAAVFAGLILMGLGAWHQRRLETRLGVTQGLPRLDLNDPRHRRNLLLTVIVVSVFLVFSAYGSYRAYEVTESVAFCGQLCHQVMEPVYTTYQNSPHARVACVECHIGEGAEWYVRAKISGLRQVYAVLADSYPRPIPVPVHNLRPAPETCEQCHWPEKFIGALEVHRHYYLPDADNTLYRMVMMLKVGGASPLHGPVSGIHWHMSVANDIRYISADETRTVIPWVEITNRETGKTTVYRTRDTPPGQELQARPVRRMDCVDCHNRPTHIFRSPNAALNISLWLDRIDKSIPGIKLSASRALVTAADAVSKQQGLDQIGQLIAEEYAEYRDPEKIRQAVRETRRIYTNNFFPEMKTNWQVRPDHSGHFIWPGCFRCHDGEHVSPQGEVISKDCNACHVIISQGLGQEPPVTDLGGVPFAHPGGEIPGGLSCNLCHTGAH